MDEQQDFRYTYSAKEQAEIKKIREKYIAPAPTEPDKMEQLRRLDTSVTRKGTTVSLILGIVGALVLGFGMSLAMTDLGSLLGIGSLSMPVGALVGVVGIVPVILAYPTYMRITKKERERIAPEILRLTDELMK